jgi:SAM-dependent methyltransferase
MRCRDVKSAMAGIWRGKSISKSLRDLEIERNVQLAGMVVDLGSGQNPTYWEHLQPTHDVEIVRVDLVRSQNGPDIVADLEDSLPLKDGVANCVLLFGVIEHIFNFSGLLNEINRVLHDGGTLYMSAPFLFRVHSDPHDYFRYSQETLERILKRLGFKQVEIISHGGLFLSTAHLLTHFFRRFRLLRVLGFLSAVGLDKVLESVLVQRPQKRLWLTDSDINM